VTSPRRHAGELDFKVDVARSGRSGRSPPGHPPPRRVATWLSSTGPRAPGTVRRPSRSRSRAALSSLTTMGTWRWPRLSLEAPRRSLPTVAMRSVSPMAWLLTPRSAAAAKSGRTGNLWPHQAGAGCHAAQAGNGAQVPLHGLRTQRASAVASRPSAPARTFHPNLPGRPCWRTPGMGSTAARICCSMPCLRGPFAAPAPAAPLAWPCALAAPRGAKWYRCRRRRRRSVV